ncbi:ATP-binding protein [Hydrogenophaga sp. R2]|uniref:hybrid sensor histidine kinase/response regulator n=1 Tax=Hydrogenophaga sp. R2 TaxID=3132827 RepID=UPI003CE8D614
MRLRPLLIAMVSTVLVLSALNLVLLAQDVRDARTLDAQQAAAEKLARDAAGLLVLTQDYMLHGSSRSVRQWVVLHGELRTALRSYAAASERGDESARELETVIEGLPMLFDSLTRQRLDGSDALGWARRELLTDQLINETRLISDGAFQLSDRVNERRRHAELRHGVIDLATLAVLLALVGSMAWLLLRRVLWPIGRLGETAERMKAGDLDARTAYRHPDELGQLAESFDAMAGTLQERDMALQTLNRQLMQSESFLDRVSRIAGVGGWAMDIATRTLTVTPQTLAIFGLPAGHQLTLDELGAHFSQPTLDTINAAARRAIVERVPGDLELPFVTAYGRERWLRLTSLAEYEGDRAVRLVGSLEDVTERRELAEVLRQAKQDAEAANEAKSLFLANMSHEIRTPLNAVIGVNNLLAASSLNAEQTQLLRKAQLAGQSLLGIVNDVLDLAKIEAGELTLDLAPLRLGRLVTEKATLFLPQTLAKGVQLEADLPNDLPTWLVGDALRIGQVINNLLSNAVKFTDRGYIRLSLRVLEKGPQGVHLRCEVADSGIGIEPEVRERLFRPFTQADASTTRRFGGTGLGLSIVRHLVELMGGTCGMDSEPGRGSTFWFTLTLQPAEHVRVPQVPGLPVFVTGGQAGDRQPYVEAARSLGWKPVEVPDLMALGQQTHQGDLAPVGSGGVVIALWRSSDAATTAALRALDGSLPGSPALVVICLDATSHIALPHTGVRADQVLSAPVEPPVLLDAVNQAVSSHQLEPQVNTTDRWLQGVRVLLVDDSEISRDIGQRLLELQGAVVQTAIHGREALERLQAAPTAFDVVLMDVQMPVMDGLQATRLIRATPGLAQLPVVALTAGALLEERRRALASGMNAFLSKPLDLARLIVEVRRVMTEAGARVPEVVSAQAQTQAPAGAGWTPVNGIDMAAARQLLCGDHGLFIGLLERFVKDTASLPGELPAWCRDTNPARREALLARLHKLRGAAGALGATETAGIGHRLEQALRQGLPADDLAQALADALARLAVAAGRALADHQGQQTQAPPAAPVALPALQALAALLQRQDLDALDRYAELAGGIRALAGDESEAALREAVQSLDFARASHLLETITPLATAS